MAEYQRADNVESSKYKTFSNEGTYTIGDAIETVGFGKFQWKTLFRGGITWIADSMEIMILSILGPVLICEWGLTSVEESFITVVVFGGFMIGSPVFGSLADRYGRRAAIILGCTWALYYGLLTSFSPNYAWLLALRCLTGVGISGVPQAVTYVSEFLPSKVRGKAVVLTQLFWAFGAIVEVALAILFLVPFGWRVWLFASAFPFLLCIPGFISAPESPRYCLIAGRYDEAVKCLEQVSKDNNVPLPPGKLEQTVVEDRGRLVDLLQPSLRRNSILTWIVWFCGAFGYYGIVLLCTELVAIDTTCPNENIGANSDQCNELTTDDYVTLLWTSCAEIPGLLLTAVFVDSLGRKPTIIAEFLLFSGVMLTLIICQSGPLLTFTLFVSRALVASAFQVAYVFTPEVNPTQYRACAMGWACAWARLGAIVTPFVAQVLLDVNTRGCILVYAAVGVLGAAASALVNMTGRDLEGTNFYANKQTNY